MANSSDKQFSIGVDYGTNSVRALVVDISTGAEIATAVFDYPSGEAGILLDSKDPNLARQNPADYIEGFYHSVASAVRDAAKTEGFTPERVVGIGVDTTGSTPIPVNKEGVALGTLPDFKDTLAAHAWLWKDHTSHAEAQEITRAASEGGLPYLAKCGGTYSSEWYWSKILHCLRTAPEVAKATYSWVELADFVPAFVTGNTNPDSLERGICSAGHKAMYHTDWGGLPSVEFLDSLEPGLSRFRYSTPAVASNHQAGKLTAEVAEKVGLKPGIPVAVGAFDAHMGAVGAGCGKGTLVKIMGTSTCDCMPAPMTEKLPDVPGLCGIVPESIMPGMYGLEAGQSAVGDIFNWFVKQLTPAKYGTEAEAHFKLTEEAAQLKPGESGLVALDWNNGNRTILVDPLLTGVLVGQTLHSTAAEVYRALVEATAFGALTIINRMEEYGVQVEDVINCGGIAEKNPMVMQIYADVCNRPMKISRSAQTCALGAAIFGAVAAGAYPSVEAAQAKMTGVKETVYQPIAENVAVYQKLFKIYSTLHDAFGTADYSGSLFHVMKDLLEIRQRARGAADA
ncbi:ribulokinase [Bythopirellula polymerisocia]|uniref:Ribulokinase n=1 Tax=Bythopirellula polymerisocia TaxID=2528003 RepID=A0A5C6CY98_9BACT|nr:ribulokinase [Bythopirellula polymerisocia]TWU29378.1 Ribulokinase [Bythopirellula polymerisocia]